LVQADTVGRAWVSPVASGAAVSAIVPELSTLGNRT